MSKRGKTALWIFVIMIVALSYAWSSFIRTGIIIPYSSGNGLHLSLNTPDLNDPDVLSKSQSLSSSMSPRKLTIRASYDNVVFKTGTDDDYHFVLRSLTNDDNPQLHVYERGNYIVVEIEHDQLLTLSNQQSELDVYVPENKVFAALELETSSGDIRFDSLPLVVFEDFQLSTTSGDIRLKDLNTQRLTATTSSGSFYGQNIDSHRYELSTTSGNIQIVSLSGKGECHTTSGDISLDLLKGGLSKISAHSGRIMFASEAAMEIETTSGDIQGSWLSAFEKSSIKTTSGRVAVDLNPQLNIKIQIVTVSGVLEDALTHENIPEDIKEHTLTLGDGSSLLEISTTSGDIRLQSIQ